MVLIQLYQDFKTNYIFYTYQIKYVLFYFHLFIITWFKYRLNATLAKDSIVCAIRSI